MADFNSLEKKLDEKFARTEEQIDTLARIMAEGFEEVHKKFDKVEEKFKVIDGRFDRIDEKLERVERNQLTQKEEIIGLETRVSTLEHPVVQ